MIPHNKLNFAEAPSMDIDETIKILKEKEGWIFLILNIYI